MTKKTNAVRLLDQLGIRYELREYEVDPEDLAAEAVAAKIGLPPGQLFKTLVAQGGRHGYVRGGVTALAAKKASLMSFSLCAIWIIIII